MQLSVRTRWRPPLRIKYLIRASSINIHFAILQYYLTTVIVSNPQPSTEGSSNRSLVVFVNQ